MVKGRLLANILITGIGGEGGLAPIKSVGAAVVVLVFWHAIAASRSSEIRVGVGVAVTKGVVVGVGGVRPAEGPTGLLWRSTKVEAPKWSCEASLTCMH